MMPSLAWRGASKADSLFIGLVRVGFPDEGTAEQWGEEVLSSPICYQLNLQASMAAFHGRE